MADLHEQMPNPSSGFLTHHTPAPLHQKHHQQQYQQQQQHYHEPRQQRGVPTVPNSSVVLVGPLPPNFIPQTLANAHGVWTLTSRRAGLHGIGTHGGISSRIIPGNPPPVFPATGPPTSGNNKPFVYGGTSPAWANKPFGISDGGGGALPSPSWDYPFGAPGISGSGGGGLSPPRGWGSANTPFIPPDVSNSAGGMTPSTARRNLFGFTGSGTDSLLGQSGVPIYGWWHPSSHSRAPVDGLWYAFEPMPAPTVPSYRDDSSDDVDWFDPTTEENTRWNAAVGRSVVDVSSGSSAPTKKKKKKKR